MEKEETISTPNFESTPGFTVSNSFKYITLNETTPITESFKVEFGDKKDKVEETIEITPELTDPTIVVEEETVEETTEEQ